MLCGIDEAGRGCAAGSLYVVGLVFHSNPPSGIKDSKKLTILQRKLLYEEIKKTSHFFIYEITSNDIDTTGISFNMKLALENIKKHFPECEFLFDGNTRYGIEDITTMIKADSKIIEVSAASIVAKYTKDIAMEKLEEKYPNFCFTKHSGYLTKKHIEEIRTNGLTEEHRKSYKIKL